MDSEDDNDELQQLVMAGDTDALAEYFQKHHGRLRRLIDLRLDPRVQPRVSASDVLQDSFVELARQYEDYVNDPQLPPFVWMRLVTGQRLTKFHRRHLGAAKRDAAREINLNNDPMPQASSVHLASRLAASITGAEDRVIRAEQQQKMEDVLNGMDDADREIISMRNFEELSNTEVAATLGLSEAAAAMRYMRALRKLQQEMKKLADVFGEAPQFDSE